MSFEDVDIEVVRALQVLARTGWLDRLLKVQLEPKPGDTVLYFPRGLLDVNMTDPTAAWLILCRHMIPALVIEQHGDEDSPLEIVSTNRNSFEATLLVLRWDHPQADGQFWAPAWWRPTEEWLRERIFGRPPREPVPASDLPGVTIRPTSVGRLLNEMGDDMRRMLMAGQRDDLADAVALAVPGVPLEEAIARAAGAEPRPFQACTECGGSGRQAEDSSLSCLTCLGRGVEPGHASVYDVTEEELDEEARAAARRLEADPDE